MESCGFRDEAQKFTEKGYVLLGASRDTPQALEAFKKKFNLPYSFLSDPQGKVAAAFGFAPGSRQTVVIGKDGKIERYYPKVSPKAHPGEVLAKLGTLDK